MLHSYLYGERIMTTYYKGQKIYPDSDYGYRDTQISEPQTIELDASKVVKVNGELMVKISHLEKDLGFVTKIIPKQIKHSSETLSSSENSFLAA